MSLDITPQVQNVFNRGTLQKLATASTTAQATNALNAQAVLLVATQACHISSGSNPSATTDSLYLPANTYLALAWTPGEKIAAIRTSADGVLFIQELN